ncbi:2-keto-4-pentenoate hydratase/2-oxopent-4-enoate/cis-2-oxohex-4-enoate hydratase [Rhodococcus sp. AG1013]|uniref:2-keto-4-pentenoate hydratase n=1 Tax=Rhodococcus sp. AG1013 TaxID=2183996 RepID=UPI000E0C3238|nr:fumarylacetoacetate hydrolase family protein [Rhodococcus sp. AG1013]RDI34054.1 2-keto-4-pentenoate hydratase/2-oxopent-4-enoate/cis-2-oxohex-4-enoate hydratase [Rhodococcus sp. AG1013]
MPTDTRGALHAAVPSLAAELAEAERTRRPIAQPTSSHPDLTVADAYEIQRRNIARRVEAGERVVGRKIGLTSLAMQRQLGVDQPDFGAILDTMVVPHEGEQALDDLVAARAEAEFTFRLASDLVPGESAFTFEQVRDAVGEVMLSLELIDSRIADWKIGLVDTVADNASSARLVAGPGVPATRELLDTLPDRILTLTRDGETVGEGPGSAVLDHPLNAIVWLADSLAQYGDHLRAGDLVLAGAVHAAVPLAAGSTFGVTSPGLPDVTVRIV